MITFAEIPDEICLSFNISNCQNNCIGCHSPELRQDIGTELSSELLTDLISKNNGITCVLFLGEGKDRKTLISLAETVKKAGLKVALYSGRLTEEIEDCLWDTFDYLKTGPYIEEFGPLNKETTNQKLFKINKKNNIFDCEFFTLSANTRRTSIPLCELFRYLRVQETTHKCFAFISSFLAF